MKASVLTVEQSLSKIPPFPPVAVRLLTLFVQQTPDVQQIAELIGGDGVFTARLLQCINSYEFGLKRTVSNLKQAVALIGVERTGQVMVAYATAAYAQAALGTDELKQCWQHTVATAVIANEIARCCERFTDIAYTAGFLHDLGRLGLMVAYPPEYQRIIQSASERRVDVLDLEREEFGVDHAEAGRLLTERWGLPSEFGAVTGRHHHGFEGSELDLARIVQVACRLADVLGYEVISPRVFLDAETILSHLPCRARTKMKGTTAELRTKIEERILECGYGGAEPHIDPAFDESVLQDSKAAAVSKYGRTTRKRVLQCVLIIAAVIASLLALIGWLSRSRTV